MIKWKYLLVKVFHQSMHVDLSLDSQTDRAYILEAPGCHEEEKFNILAVLEIKEKAVLNGEEDLLIEELSF